MRLPRLRDDRLSGNRYFSLTITRVSHDCPLSLSLSSINALRFSPMNRCIDGKYWKLFATYRETISSRDPVSCRPWPRNGRTFCRTARGTRATGCPLPAEAKWPDSGACRSPLGSPARWIRPMARKKTSKSYPISKLPSKRNISTFFNDLSFFLLRSACGWIDRERERETRDRSDRRFSETRNRVRNDGGFRRAECSRHRMRLIAPLPTRR